jgi:hypothetical protein
VIRSSCLVVALAAVGLVLAAAAAAPAHGAPAADEKSPYDATQINNSYWCGPPAKFNTLDRYQQIKDAGFTLAFPSCGGYTVEQNKQMLESCRQVGLKAMISDGRMAYAVNNDAATKAKFDAMIADYSKYPALFGYFIADEPAAGAFPGLAQVISYLREKDPQHVSFVNLLPTYAGAAVGTKTYEEYVRQFAKQAKPFVLSWDHYHFTNHGDRADYFDNLAAVRKVSLETHIPFWQIVLVTQHGDYRNETEPEMRYDAMQTLAFGGRGLLWFTYWSPADSDKSLVWSHALINEDGTKDPHYDMVKGINRDAKAIGDALGKAASVAVFQTGADAKIKRPAEENTIVPLEGKLTVGVFKDAGGKRMALVTNRDIKQAAKTRVTISPTNAAAEVFDPAGKTWSPATVAERGVLPLEIPAGGGVLLRW